MAIVSEVAELVLEKLRLGDGTKGLYMLVGEIPDTKHPIGFTGHNHGACKVPTLMVLKKVVDARDVYVFHVLKVHTTAHHARRSRGEQPRWEEESICLFDRDGAAAQLHLLARYMDGLDVYPATAIADFKDENGTLPDTFRRSIGRGALTARTLYEAKHAVALLDARGVKGV